MNRRRLPWLAALSVLLPGPSELSGQPMTFPEIAVGASVEGTLPPEGPALSSRGPFTVHRFTGKPGVRYVADARSGEFDAYLILARPVGGLTEFLEEDDDGGEGRNARLRFSVPEAGTYLLVVQSLHPGAGGPFTLSLEERELPPPAPPRPIGVGEVVEGRLSEASQILITDWDEEIPYDLFSVEGREGGWYVISLASPDFDAFLEFGPLVEGELVVQESDDDGGEGRDALLRVRLPHDGVFGIRARSLGSWEPYGAYTLRVEPYEPAPAVRRPIQAGETVSAALSSEDAVADDGAYYQEWVYEGTAGERLRVRMRSDDFDAFLSLGRQGPEGAFEELASNDDAPDDGLNSLIEFVLPATGTYVIRARSLYSGGSGSYTLEVARDG